MKKNRYKQEASLNFSGIDDEINIAASSYYNTKFKLFDNTGMVCTPHFLCISETTERKKAACDARLKRG
jgi:hypothetical protein